MSSAVPFVPPLSPTAEALRATYPAGIHPDLCHALALRGVTADRISFHASDVHIGCPTHSEAVAIREAGKWRSMADVYRTNTDHPDAKRWPYGVDVPFAALSRVMVAKGGQS